MAPIVEAGIARAVILEGPAEHQVVEELGAFNVDCRELDVIHFQLLFFLAHV
jgi:hypothetical protein